MARNLRREPLSAGDYAEFWPRFNKSRDTEVRRKGFVFAVSEDQSRAQIMWDDQEWSEPQEELKLADWTWVPLGGEVELDRPRDKDRQPDG